MNFITKIETVNTGGGSMVDLLTLKDGKLLAMNEECIALYKNEAAFYGCLNGEPDTDPLQSFYY